MSQLFTKEFYIFIIICRHVNLSYIYALILYNYQSAAKFTFFETAIQKRDLIPLFIRKKFVVLSMANYAFKPPSRVKFTELYSNRMFPYNLYRIFLPKHI